MAAVAHGALAVAFLAQAADGDARLLAAHDQVGVVLRHRGAIFLRVDAVGDAFEERGGEERGGDAA